MGTLGSSLNIAVQALLADQEAINTTTNNIANANTPGYSRETVNLSEAPPVEYGGQLLGDGVEAGPVTSQYSSVLQMRLDQETQQQGQLNSYLGSLQQVQTLFNETSGTGLQSSITAFFTSLQQLSENPSDTSTRQSVLAAAGDMADSFQSASSQLTTLQSSIDQSVSATVAQVNSLTSQIAQLNGEVVSATATGQGAGTLIDQRGQLINQLSGLIDVSEISAGNGSLTLTTSSGAALVVGNQSFQLATQTNASTGFQDVYSQGSDITSQISGGALGGDIQARDTAIPSVLSSLDALASNLENSVNSVSHAGFDLSGNPGGNFFVPPPASGSGAAAAMQVAITDPSQIAASSDGAAGDNGNVNAMLALQNQNIVNGQTPINAYAALVSQIGNDVSSAQAESSGAQAMTQQIQNQIGSLSGVSINEESANLIQYQQAYEAAAQVAEVIDTLTATAINLGQAQTVSA